MKKYIIAYINGGMLTSTGIIYTSVVNAKSKLTKGMVILEIEEINP